MEPLYSYEIGGTAPEPVLAEKCEANADSTVWTCTLREGVKFHDGATLDALDVVTHATRSSGMPSIRSTSAGKACSSTGASSSAGT